MQQQTGQSLGDHRPPRKLLGGLSGKHIDRRSLLIGSASLAAGVGASSRGFGQSGNLPSHIGLVAIQSVRFPNAYLRIDGAGVTQSNGGGSGTVNCQFYAQNVVPTPNIGVLEVFELSPLLTLGQEAYAIRSLNNPQAFLRIDGSGVTQFNGAGSGTVNCQYYAPGTYPNVSSDYEALIIAPSIVSGKTYYVIHPSPFPNAYLRIDGSGVTQFNGAGSGTVNCQFYPTGQVPNSLTDYELFNISFVQ